MVIPGLIKPCTYFLTWNQNHNISYWLLSEAMLKNTFTILVYFNELLQTKNQRWTCLRIKTMIITQVSPLWVINNKNYTKTLKAKGSWMSCMYHWRPFASDEGSGRKTDKKTTKFDMNVHLQGFQKIIPSFIPFVWSDKKSILIVKEKSQMVVMFTCLWASAACLTSL